MGSEDFAYYLEQIPGAMYRLGCGFENGKKIILYIQILSILMRIL